MHIDVHKNQEVILSLQRQIAGEKYKCLRALRQIEKLREDLIDLGGTPPRRMSVTYHANEPDPLSQPLNAMRTVPVASHADLLPTEETAQLIGITAKSLERMSREGRGPKRVRIGNRSYYSRRQLECWLSEQFSGEAV
jgi:predicted DNA-binding transcriptional regulator AlpA